jgi:hypothetical protein
MREKWTDERLDDLNHYVRDGFDRIDKDLRALRAEMSAEIGALRAEISAEIGGLRAETNARFDSLQRTLLQLGGGMLVTFVVGFASLLVTQS